MPSITYKKSRVNNIYNTHAKLEILSMDFGQEGTWGVKVEMDKQLSATFYPFLKTLTSCFLGAAGAVEVMNPAESESRASSVLSGF